MVRALDYIWDAQTARVRASAAHFSFSDFFFQKVLSFISFFIISIIIAILFKICFIILYYRIRPFSSNFVIIPSLKEFFGNLATMLNPRFRLGLV